jgi:hypothetical protein
MKRTELAKLTVDELVARFAEIGLAQDQAIEKDNNRKFRKLYNEMEEVDQELRSRGRDARLALMRLYDYPNMQVRLKAAIHTLGVAPGEARRLIQGIADSKWPPQALDAGMTIRNLDYGIFVPD